MSAFIESKLGTRPSSFNPTEYQEKYQDFIPWIKDAILQAWTQGDIDKIIVSQYNEIMWEEPNSEDIDDLRTLVIVDQIVQRKI